MCERESVCVCVYVREREGWREREFGLTSSPPVSQVCDRVLNLRTPDCVASDVNPSLEPVAEMIPGNVRWPGRDAYPSYFASTRL